MLIVRNLIKKKIDEGFLRHVALTAQKNLPDPAKKYRKAEINLIIIGEKRMKTLNRVWRGKDKATDVLSFGDKDAEGGGGFISAPDGADYLGEIFICYPAAEKQARKYGFSIREEMARLAIHGILHLAGYDHEKNAREEKIMMELQEKILKKI